MKRDHRLLSQALLAVGGMMIVASLGWIAWRATHRPPDAVITDAGAVVLAVTSRPTPTRTEVGPTSTAEPSRPIAPAPVLLPEWEELPAEVGPSPSPTTAQETAVPPTRVPPAPTPPRAETPPTRIVAPAINLDAKVVPMGWEMIDRKGRMVSEWRVPENAAGWHINSALPGNQENVVLSGHHNIQGKVFRYVVDLQPGDEITVYVGKTPYAYIVSEKYILKEAGMPLSVRQKNAQWIMPTGDERLTLVTCWPYEWPGNTHRVIVVARPPANLPFETDNQQ